MLYSFLGFKKDKQDFLNFLIFFSGVNEEITDFASRDDECENDSDEEDDVYFPPDINGNIIDVIFEKEEL